MALLRYDYILFDFDGTIADSQEGILNCVEHAFKCMGREVPPREELYCFCGPALVDMFMRAYDMSEEEAFRATAFFRERYNVLGWQEARIYEGVTPLLKALKAHGAYVAIASSKPQVFLERITESAGIRRYFDAIVGTTAENKSSDKRGNVLKAIPEGADMSRVCMVGDRCYDIEAGRALGLDSLGAVYGYGSKEELEDAGATALADTPRALYELLLPGEKFPRGKFISFEGADGCGKSTQLSKAADWLRERGFEVLVTREPGGSPVSEAVRNILLDVRYKGMSDECEALLFAAARSEHVRHVIVPALEEGKIVLCDRYIDSSLAYQGCARELGCDFIRHINVVAMGLPTDRTLLFTGRRETVSERLRASGELDRIESEKDDFVRRVYEGYEKVRLEEPGRVREIASDRGIDDIFTDVCAELTELLY